jgi:3-oxoacyl-[acyl-carrier protein] reductase
LASLVGKVAVITGAASGLGGSVALQMAKAGVKVALGDIRDCAETVQRVKSAGGEAVACLVDVSQPAQVQALAALAIRTYGAPTSCTPMPEWLATARMALSTLLILISICGTAHSP